MLYLLTVARCCTAGCVTAGHQSKNVIGLVSRGASTLVKPLHICRRSLMSWRVKTMIHTFCLIFSELLLVERKWVGLVLYSFNVKCCTQTGCLWYQHTFKLRIYCLAYLCSRIQWWNIFDCKSHCFNKLNTVL